MGRLSRAQGLAIATLSAEVRPEHVLETGFGTGRSAASILSSGSVKKMISIDIDLSWTGKYEKEVTGVFSRIHPCHRLVKGDSNLILTDEYINTEFPSGIDLLMIDGDHSYDGCIGDLLSCSEYMNNSGVIIVDDYLSSPPRGKTIKSVDMAVADFLSKFKDMRLDVWNCEGRGMAIIRMG